MQFVIKSTAMYVLYNFIYSNWQYTKSVLSYGKDLQLYHYCVLCCFRHFVMHTTENRTCFDPYKQCILLLNDYKVYDFDRIFDNSMQNTVDDTFIIP